VVRKSKAVDLSIRSPTQARSRTTVEAIVEAATQILQHDGLAQLNTNLIATRAGTSIGTLYQYFPNKQAILLAIAQRQLRKDRAGLMEAISQALATPDAELDRIIIRKAIELHQGNTEVRRALMQNLIALGRDDEITRTMQELVALLSEQVAPSLPNHLQPVSATTVFILAHAIEGAIRAAAHTNRPLLDSREFEDDLVLIVRAYLRGAADARSAKKLPKAASLICGETGQFEDVAFKEQATGSHRQGARRPTSSQG
jgi:AcrR family transcriptional regulator